MAGRSAGERHRALFGTGPAPGDRLRLFCFPYAGGNAAAYRGLRAAAPTGLGVYPVELPGRGRRIREVPHTAMASLVASLADDLQGALDRPYALLGHSLGGLIAYELAVELRERGAPPPAHLFLSAIAAPQWPRTGRPLHRAGEAEVRAALLAMGGTPPELLANEEIMALALPVLRADHSVLETYRYRPRPPLPLPVTVFGGSADEVAPPEVLGGWREHSDRPVAIRLFPGGHFFLTTAPAEVMRGIAHGLGLLRPAR
ncbi:thioesterase II family protein [Streptomyces pactum]|uniref:thioesterase II family protein n=1 Tax=Streptomyces pactum TaxID=68249 RepID=UPI0027DDA561|nr:alpha/beta fold hydrolase [Streptomyces pactum]